MWLNFAKQDTHHGAEGLLTDCLANAVPSNLNSSRRMTTLYIPPQVPRPSVGQSQ